MAKKISVEDDRMMKRLGPMWQRIAKGEVDLSEYTDEEILSARIRMEDGRLAPKPAHLPERFVDEQVKRGFKVAQRKIREGADRSLDVYFDILKDKKASNADRMKAAQFFTDRQFGKEPIPVKVSGGDPVESLFKSILEDPNALLEDEDAEA